MKYEEAKKELGSYLDTSIYFSSCNCSKDTLKIIEKTIDKMEQPFKNILYFKYIEGFSLKEISENMLSKKYEYKYCCLLHKKAINQYKEIRSKGEHDDN